MSQDDEFLTTKQVSERWPFLPATTLRTWRANGTGPASFAVGAGGRSGKVMYRRSEVERWLKEQEATSTRGGAA